MITTALNNETEAKIELFRMKVLRRNQSIIRVTNARNKKQTKFDNFSILSLGERRYKTNVK